MNKGDVVDDANIDSLWCALGCFEDKTVLLSCICIKGRDLRLKCRWYELMEHAARKENNRPVMIEALSNLYLNQWGQGESYYKVLKSTISTEEWPSFIENLANQAQRKSKEKYADICAWEGWTDRLMDYLQQVDYLGAIIQYEPYLLPQHQCALTNRYIHLAWEMMDKNERNRSTYQQIREVLQQAVNIGGKEAVTQAITDMKTQFKRYRALVEELGMIG